MVQMKHKLQAVLSLQAPSFGEAELYNTGSFQAFLVLIKAALFGQHGHQGHLCQGLFGGIQGLSIFISVIYILRT